jgi:hypothetical protein
MDPLAPAIGMRLAPVAHCCIPGNEPYGGAMNTRGNRVVSTGESVL